MLKHMRMRSARVTVSDFLRRWAVQRQLGSLLNAWGDDLKIVRSLGGQARGTWLVRGTRQRFVLRTVGGEYEIMVLKHLARRAWPYGAPLMLPAADGTMSKEAAGRLWTLYPFIDGVSAPARKTPAQAAELGHLVGSLDQLLAEVELPGAEFQLQLFTSPDPGLCTSPSLSEGERAIVRSAQAWLETKRDSAAAALAEMPTQTVHNDLHDNNLLFEGERLVGLIDFDSLATAPRVVDLQNALLFLLAEPANREEEIVTPLAQAYRKELPVTESELQIVPVLLVDRLLSTISQILAERPLKLHRRAAVSRYSETLSWLLPRSSWLTSVLTR